MKYTGELLTGDFEENTMTFEIEGEMILQAGKYTIEQIQVGNQVKNLGIANVRQQSELLNAFLEWRLTKPHSDFQTREHDIKEFLEAFNCA